MIAPLLLSAVLLADPAPAPAPPAAAAAAAAAEKGPPVAEAVRPFDAQKPGQVLADDLRFNMKTRRFTVVGKPLVTMVHDDATLTCRKLTGENDAGNKLKVATCEGEVQLVRAGRVVTCERASYDRPAGRLTCSGNPLFKDPGGTEMRGSTLTYDLVADEIRIEQGQITVPGAEIDAGMPALKGLGRPKTPAQTPAPPPPGGSR